MNLIRVIVEPGAVLSQVRNTSWIAPIIASGILFLISGLLMINATGTQILFDSARAADPKAFGEKTTLVDFQSQMFRSLVFGAGFTAARVLVIAITIWISLRYFFGPADYSIILAICSYASYLTELVGLIIRLIVVLYHYTIHLPLAGPVVLNTNITFLSHRIPTGGVIGSLASSIDILSLGLAFVVAFGLSKRIGGLGLGHAIQLVAIPWATWTLLKAILDIRKPQ